MTDNTLPGDGLSILWMSNAPWNNTAYGIQTRQHVPRLRQLGCKVAVFAFHGLQNGVLNWDGINVLPPGYTAWGNDIVAAHAREAGANLIMPNMDAWVLEPKAFRDIPYVPRFPVDMWPLSGPIEQAIRPALARVVETRFGERMVTDAGMDALYVPAVVDCGVYTPGDRAEARRALGWPEDKFIVAMVAANKGSPSRKAFGANFGGFAQFAAKRDDALLYVHSTKGEHGEMDGEHLPNLTMMYGLGTARGPEEWGPQRRVLFPEQYRMVTGCSDAHMVNIYRAADILLAVSLGEGFCVPVVEAQACGTPVIASGWTATEELIFAGYPVRRYERYPHSRFGAWQGYPHEKSIGNTIAAAYAHLRTDRYAEEHVREFAEKARAGALAYDADHVAETHWRPALAEIRRRLEALPRGARLFPRALPAPPPQQLYDAIAQRDQARTDQTPAEAWYHEHRYGVAVRMVQPYVRTFSRVVDLGCGDGALLSRLGGSRTGVDISAVRLSRASAPGARLVVGDVATWGEPEAADVVLCTEVIEHLPEPERLLANICRILTPDGVALVGTLNDPLGMYCDGVEHLTAYGADLLEEQAAAAGLEVIARDSTVPDIYGPGGLLAAPERLADWQGRAAAGDWAYAEGSNLFVLLRRKGAGR